MPFLLPVQTSTPTLVFSVHKLIQKKKYTKALKKIHKGISTQETNNFWFWYLGAVVYVCIQDLSSAKEYLIAAQKIAEEEPHAKLLEAAIHVYENRMEDAMSIWVHLDTTSQSKLANQYIEAIRINQPLHQMAKQNIQYFFQIPKVEIMYPVNHTKLQNKQKNSILWNSGILTLYILIPSTIIVYITLPHILKSSYIQPFLQKHLKPHSTPNIYDLQVSHARVIQNLTTSDILYVYTKPKQITSDFEKAKKLLLEKKVNQARFLLQRLLHSNANFSSKEQAKILIEFIPDLDPHNFQDFISAAEVFSHFFFYQNSQILWKVTVEKHTKIQGGTLFYTKRTEGDSTYHIHAFLPTEENHKNWLYKTQHPNHLKDIELSKKDAFLFGFVRKINSEEGHLRIDLQKIWY